MAVLGGVAVSFERGTSVPSIRRMPYHTGHEIAMSVECLGVGALHPNPLEQIREVDLIPASIHHEYDSSPGHWSRQPHFWRNGSNSLWGIVFMMNTRPDEI